MENSTKNIMSQASATAKGVHIFSVCDAKSEEAQRLSTLCDQVAARRLKHIAERNAEMMPLEVEFHEMNAELPHHKVGSSNYKRLTLHQELLLEKIAKISRYSKKYLNDLWEEYRFFVEKLEAKYKVRELVVENITTTIGRSVLAQRLGGDTTYSGTVNYTALGDDNTAPAVGDATLGNEVYRKALSSGTDSSNVAYLETFFTASEVSGTFEEYGMFIDGSGAADSGQLFNRFVSTIAKSVTETLNVQSIVTFSDA